MEGVRRLALRKKVRLLNASPDGIEEAKYQVALSERFAPLYFRRSKAGNHILTYFERAEYLLIDVVEGDFQDGEIVYDYFGTCVSALALNVGTTTYIYYKINQMLYPMTVQIKAVLSRHFTGDVNFYWDDPSHLDNVFLGLGVPRRKQYHHTAATIADLPKAKISGAHHIHYTASEVWDALDDSQKARAMEAFRLPTEVTTTMMAGVLLWLACLPARLYSRVIALDILDADSMVEFAKRAKKLSVRAKSYQNIVPDDLRPVFEADVLVNRDVGEVDWQAEHDNRVRPNTVRVSPERIYEEVVTMLTRPDASKERVRRMTWDKFWGARWQWSAAGSVHSQYPEDTELLPKQRELRNKFIALNLMPDVKYDYFASREPELQAWSSIKYEWGKMRAIYGTDLTSYIHAHFAFFNCEDTLPNEFPVGAKARPSYVTSKVNAVLKNAQPLCVDFEDFNSQHSLESMAAVIRAYIHTQRNVLTEEQVKSAEWTLWSLYNTTVHDNMGLKQSYRSAGTLMSGWRLTTYVNSVLNYVYTKLLLEGTDSIVHGVHNGDDVLLGVKNFDIARRVAYNASKYNIRLQLTKCAFGGIAEFLRVDRHRGDYGQYITRNIATLMHSRIESKVSLSVLDVIAANEERLLEHLRRDGLYDVTARLRYTYLRRISKIYDTPVLDLYRALRAHRVVGGCDGAPDAPIEYEIIKERTSKVAELPEKMPGVRAYARDLKRVLELDVAEEKIADRVYNATLNAVQLVRTSINVQRTADKNRAAVFRALYKAHADVAEMPLYGKAMLTGFVFDVLASQARTRVLVSVMKASKDPMTFLSVVA